jgi:hypothetical protein
MSDNRPRVFRVSLQTDQEETARNKYKNRKAKAKKSKLYGGRP